MKNIYLLPTDKPSRIVFIKGTSNGYHLFNYNDNNNYKSYNIYITSDEEIKINDYYYNSKTNSVSKKLTNDYQNHFDDMFFRKIILTTEPDLIKDGVQAIEDDFLEWFVKNPSCVFVDVKPLLSNNQIAFFGYKIIIPKKEFKQVGQITEKGIIDIVGNCGNCGVEFHIHKEFKQEGYICPHTKLQCDDECCVSAEDCHIKKSIGILSDKQETLKEIATKEGLLRTSQHNYNQASAGYNAKWFKRGAIFGANWQAEQNKKMYSEKEVLKFTQNMIMQYKFGNTNIEKIDLLKESLEQFKKK